ncbi:MAG TPA: DUF2752 domain-containing protein [Planctomycetaceae bacterium]|nr:DUF2752 domain-containing protein [Planctomycetaceae bacterium]
MSDSIAADPEISRIPASGQNDRSRRSLHVNILWLAVAVIALSAALQVLPDGRVAFIGWESSPLPHTCMSRRMWNVSCPGCGLTRSFIYLAHGQWRESLAVHRVGWLLALLVVVQIPYRLLCLARPQVALPPSYTNRVCISVVALLVVNWLLNLVLPA